MEEEEHPLLLRERERRSLFCPLSRFYSNLRERERGEREREKERGEREMGGRGREGAIAVVLDRERSVWSLPP
jgi:hypothetical protein